MLLHALDRADRVGLGRREELVEATADDVRAAERVRRADDREQVVALVQLGEREAQPLDVGRGRGRVLGRPEERDVGAVPARDLGDLLRVGRHHHPPEHAALERGRDRVREQRVTRERPDVLLRHALRA